MSKYGFLDVLQEELDKNFPFDFEINWDKKNHAVEVAFLLEEQNTGGRHPPASCIFHSHSSLGL